MKDVNDVPGTVGSGCWCAFKKRHAHRIVSKRGHKFELDRSNLTTYANFEQMHDNIATEMIEDGIVVELEEPACKDRNGNTCSKEDSFGCKVTHEIIHHHYALVAHELGGNISQKGDSHVGGTKLLCEKGSVPRK